MIKYKLVKSELTDNYFPQQVDASSFTMQMLADKLRKRYGDGSEAVLRDAIALLAERIAMGDVVTVDRLGTFSVRLETSEKGASNEDEIHTGNVAVSGVRFRACKQLRERLAEQPLHKVKVDPAKQCATIEDRWVRLYDHMLKTNQLLAVSEYRMITGATDYTARKDLARFVAEGKLELLKTSHVQLYMLPVDLMK